MTIKHSFLKKMSLMMAPLAVMMSVGLLSQTALAKSISVVATVDGTPISNIDFEERRNFLIKTTGISYNDSNREQIDSDVLQMLVDDVIKINEGASFGSGFAATARQRASDLVNQSFSQNGEDPDQVLKALGISRDTAEKKFLADVLWASTIQSRFNKQFSKTRDEAERELERIKKNIQKPHADLDEIVLLPEPNRNYAATRQLGDQIFDALRSGADFSRIAQQYSAAGSSQQGGKLGWVALERLSAEIRAIVEDAPAGAVTRPMDIDGAVVIYRINSLRINGQSDPFQSIVDLYRLVLPADMTNGNSVNAGRAALASDIQAVSTCAELDMLHQNYGSGLNVDMGQFKIIDFAPRLREVIVGLGTNDKSDIINFSEGLVVFMVCKRVDPEIILPSLDELEVSIRNKHYSALSARYLSRLRKKAIITYEDRP